MIRFFKGIAREMKATTWPGPKQSWHDFVMVVEYTIFFMLFLLLFDWAFKNGISFLVQVLAPLVKGMNM